MYTLIYGYILALIILVLLVLTVIFDNVIKNKIPYIN